MAYDVVLADRVREVLAPEPGVFERAMFGGLAFLINGNMAVAASGQGGLLLRCDPAQTDRLVTSPRVARMEMRGREMDGWLRVEGEAVRTGRDLGRWVKVGADYAASLPPK